ncbi:amidohydrolase family protein [Pseudomarimonas salicorniae]|uniref:Amidohydrolase family protein n=1 Tax=Pseudomarimonas salicorniae TaxID=2933270 RepID=A0ABT0GIY0_9GAMM|nr:amidohydrolase family protein [Lysobacter sp. CAU 1642]MCK7594519.1 amidohydrolase family protein [Lysobacter sp. CAU 1642]
MYRPIALALGLLVLAGTAEAAPPTQPDEGIADRTPISRVLYNARIVVAPGEVIERGRIVIRDGVIERVEAGGGAVEGLHGEDLGGRSVFYGLIEPLASVGVPKSLRAESGEPEEEQPEAGPRHWNARVRPERELAGLLQVDPEEARALREQGFALAHAVPARGIWRGRGALLHLGDTDTLAERVLLTQTAQQAAFETGDPFGGEYPGSKMGAIALVRQSLLDARWFADVSESGAPPEANLSWPALGEVLAGRSAVWWRAGDELDGGRVAMLSREFGLRSVLVGSGSEYRVLPTLKAAGLPVIAPLRFPEAPEAGSASALLAVSLATLQHWEQAPANPGRIAAAGLPLALTAAGLDSPADFWPALRRAVRAGLSETQALAALTTVPAELLGQSQRLGRIAPGHSAHLLVADESLFREDDAQRYQLYIGGRLHLLRPLADAPPLGRWQLSGTGQAAAEFEVSGADEITVELDGQTLKADWQPPQLRFVAPAGWLGSKVPQPLSLRLERGMLRGLRSGPGGQALPVEAQRIGEVAETETETEEETPAIAVWQAYPAGAFGLAEPPARPRHLLIRGATVWTQGPDGVLENADVLVSEGRIARVGSGLAAPAGAEEIDAHGLHLTPGLVDAHSHSAIAHNLNEPSHAVTTEVRVGDVLDPSDISIYRQLASGVTTVLALHGSANPMGGQSATLKWRWGSDAEGLRFAGAPGGVKFALGENVKQSNWGERFTTRYPQTRMGVATLMRDRLNAARAYAAEQAAYAKRPRGPAPRRDLRLEALAEVLDGSRLVHIHSYRQDEILMFARLSQEYSFRVGSFTHILEGYKVADVLAEIGAGASTFSDWWAYKMEVYDGIPYNAAILHRQGVLTSLNSDSDEMARRLNTEAAKAVKYGGVAPAEALSMVTLNPARQMGVGERIGSIEPGKDADLVLWNAPPLSSFARVEQTWIEGRRYFSRSEDAALRQRDEAERQRLLGKLLSADRPEKKSKDSAPKAADEPWLHLQHPAHRGLYHDGSDIAGCRVADHLH